MLQRTGCQLQSAGQAAARKAFQRPGKISTSVTSMGQVQRPKSSFSDELMRPWGTPESEKRYGPGQQGKRQFTESENPKWLRGTVVTVFGATGFVADAVLSKFANLGAQIICPFRPMTNNRRAGQQEPRRKGLNSTTLVEYDPSNYEELLTMVSRSNIVINCAGRAMEPALLSGDLAYGYEAVYANLPRNIARACYQAGVDRLIHISHVNADSFSDSVPLKMKGLGDQFVRDEFPRATILKPCDVVGHGDNYLTLMATLAFFDQCWPVLKNDKKVQPLMKQDLGAAVLRAALQADAAGQTYELGGPKVYDQKDVYHWVCTALGLHYRYTTIPPYMKMFGAHVRGRRTNLTRFWLDEQYRNTVASDSALSWEDLSMDKSNLIEIDEGALDSIQSKWRASDFEMVTDGNPSWMDL